MGNETFYWGGLTAFDNLWSLISLPSRYLARPGIPHAGVRDIFFPAQRTQVVKRKNGTARSLPFFRPGHI